MELPKEVVIDILTYLNPDDVAKASRVCSPLNKYAQDNWIS